MWMRQIQKNADEHIRCILLANKCDIQGDERKVSKEEGEKLAAHYQLPFFETSAKANLNVIESFNKLSEDLLDLIEEIGVDNLAGVSSGKRNSRKLKSKNHSSDNKKGGCKC